MSKNDFETLCVFLGACLITIAFCGQAVAQDNETSLSQIRVACVGDSITAGARVNADTESYPARLQELLGDGYQVRNFGLGSATLIKSGKPNVWQKLDSVRKFQPHVVIIALGTNDTVGDKRRNWERIDRFDDDYRDLIDQLAGLPTKPQIVLCTPTSMVLQTEGLSAERLANLTERKPRLQQLCRQIRDLAVTHAGKNVSLLELNSVLNGRTDLVTVADGVHPNREGYVAIATAVAEQVKRLVDGADLDEKLQEDLRVAPAKAVGER